MSARIWLCIASSFSLLAACATHQENPNYQYSTKYKAGVPTTTYASSTAQSVPVSYQGTSYASSQSVPSHQVVSQGTHSATSQTYANSTQLPANYQYATTGEHVVYQSPRIVHQSPTDTQFSSISETGTPGYQVLQSQVITDPAPIAVAQASSVSNSSAQGAQLVDYDYSENIVSASAYSVPEYSETRYLNGDNASHRVKEGDTVYSLARRNCVTVGDIQSINGLNTDFSIKIGDDLRLPASRC